MRDTIQGLGWYIRRTPDVPTLGPFYQQWLGLPLLRPTPRNVYVFWGGETLAFEVLAGGTPPPAYADPVAAPVIPVFRAHGLDGLVTRLKTGGARVLLDRDEALGRTAYLLDPLGHLTGFREANRNSRLAQDVEALRRWDAGETQIAGVDPLPPDLQDLGWVVMHVVDVQREVAFYRDVVGLDVVLDDGGPGGHPGAVLSLGDTALLELRPGGRLQPIPKADRTEVVELWELRICDLPGMVRDLEAAGSHFVHEPFQVLDAYGLPTGGTVAHFVDPEGHLVAIQDHPFIRSEHGAK